MQTFDFETAAYANFATPAAKAINVTSCRSSSQQSLAFCDNVPENGAFLALGNNLRNKSSYFLETLRR